MDEREAAEKLDRLGTASSSLTDLSKIASVGIHDHRLQQLASTLRQMDHRPPMLSDRSDSESKEQLQLVIASAEMAPYSKTGGLGDVIGSLPFALADRGHRVMIVTPRYLNGSTDALLEEAKDTRCDIVLDMGHGGQQNVKFFLLRKKKVDVVFVDHPCFHRDGNPYGDAEGAFKDNTFRFAVLSMAACEAPLHIPCRDETQKRQRLYGEDVIFFANDWHTALIPAYLEAKYHPHGVFLNATCVMYLCMDPGMHPRDTVFRGIHNLAHQGIESPAMFHNLGIPESYDRLLEWVTDDGTVTLNILKGGLVTADRIITVSCMHAFDMLTAKGSMGLRPIIRGRQDAMNGIVNGIDDVEWNPETDTFIAQR